MSKTPEQLKAERIARQERDAEAALEGVDVERRQVSGVLMILGVVLILAGAWFLLASPSQSSYGGEAVINLHRLTIGETAAIAGAILFSAGAIIRYR
jgi:drug/metabolite transporter (DMT)-like permease